MCDSCDWEDLLIKIEEAMDSGEYDWCSDTLEGIHAWVQEAEHCTEPQKQAISSISGSVSW